MTPTQPPRSAAWPRAFGRYQLVRRIAVGGMAEIFQARAPAGMGGEKDLVIKRLLPQFVGSPELLQMFVAEAKLVGRLQHPNIVQVHELGEHAGQYFIAMELVRGMDAWQLWRTLAKRGLHLPVPLALFVVGEVLKGLDCAHRCTGPDGKPLGVVHRDISLSNILISHLGEVKVSDFGIALVRQENKTLTGVLKGKLGYMSPEQVGGQRPDARSDIFSAAVVLAELVLGRRLFLARTVFETLSRVMNADLRVLEQDAAALSAPLLAILRRALGRDPDQRFPTAWSFFEAVRELLFEEPRPVARETLAAFLKTHVTPVLVLPDEDSPELPWEEPAEQTAEENPGELPVPRPPPGPASTLPPPAPELHLEPEPMVEDGQRQDARPHESLEEPGRRHRQVDIEQLEDVEALSTAVPEPAEEGAFAVLREDLGRRSLASLLVGLAADQETGLLVVRRGSAGPQGAPAIQLHHRAGEPRLCAADWREDELLAFLIRLGCLGRGEVASALARFTGRRPLTAVMAAGAVSPLEVTRNLASFVVEQTLEAFRWTQGELEFFPGRAPTGAFFPTGLGTGAMIARGVGGMSEGQLDSYFRTLKAGTIRAATTPPVELAAFPPSLPLKELYLSLRTARPLAEALADASGRVDSRRGKQALYLLFECRLLEWEE